MSARMRRSSVLVTVAMALTTLGMPVGGAPAGAAPKLAACPLGAIAKLKANKLPVALTLWHSLPQGNQVALAAMADRFNASQRDVKVSLELQPSYDATLQKFISGLKTGDLPGVAMLQEVDLQKAIDTGAMLPAQSCIKADKYSMADTLARVRSYFTVDGVLWPMPFNTSTPLLYFDQHDFRAAGLDPSKPPATLDALVEAARKLKISGIKYPLELKIDSWYIEHWFAQANRVFTDHNNGRRGRASKVLINNATGRKIFKFFETLQREGLVRTSEKNQFDNLLGVASGDASMTMDTSSALGTIKSVLEGGGIADKELELGVGPLPGPTGSGGVTIGGGSLHMVRKGQTRAEQEAAWRFVKFTNRPEIQAEWSAASGYVPIRKAALKSPVLARTWAASPGYQVAYDQLVAGKESSARAGSVIGPSSEVRTAMIGAMKLVLDGRKTARQALRIAVSEANAAIAEYEARIGG